jgi:hypothetical protein
MIEYEACAGIAAQLRQGSGKDKRPVAARLRPVLLLLSSRVEKAV